MKAMSSDGNQPIDLKVDVDEAYVWGQDENARGLNEGKKEFIAMALGPKGMKDVSRPYLLTVVETTARKLKWFILAHIVPGGAVSTDQLSGYRGL